jgi:hypothetical protein
MPWINVAPNLQLTLAAPIRHSVASEASIFVSHAAILRVPVVSPLTFQPPTFQ